MTIVRTKTTAPIKKTRARKQAGNSSAMGVPLPAEAKAFTNLVLLQKTKQELLQAKQIGPEELDAFLADYLKVILSMTAAGAGSILLLEGDELVFHATIGPGSHRLIGRRMPAGEGIAGWVARNGTTCVSADVSTDPRWSGKISAELHFKTKNIMAVPLRGTDKVIGVIEIINKTEGRRFRNDDQALLESLAGQLALDVAYARLLAGSQKEAGRRIMQMQLANVLNSTLDQREVRNRAMESATSLMDAEVGSLLLVDEKTNDLFFEVALGEQGKRLKEIRLKMGEGIAGWVAANDQPALINDVENDPRYFKKARTITQFVTRNMVCVPVRSRGTVIGVLQAINKKGGGFFTEDDLDNLWTLSNQVAVALENAHLYAELKDTFLHTAEALAAAVEKKDPYTGGHIKRVVEYSVAIARYIDGPPEDLEQLRLAAVLHDIGKIGIRDSVLLKQSGLTPEELAQMQQHPLVGADILGHIEQMKHVSKIMRSHHERWDGSGYPDGLKGNAIPLPARIISVADTFDAITTDRPYRKAADLKTAAEEIKKFSAKDFDPVVVEAFLKATESGDILVPG